MIKTTRITLLFIMTIMATYAYNQCDTLRYKAPIFTSITEHHNVNYGSAPVWTIPYNNKELFMNIYTPDNDTLEKRPLMIWAHSGGFLNGSKDADDMVALCDSFARRGYVTATIDYRLGFNPASKTSAERAVYRAVQDTRAAIRFLKEHADTYGIDTNYTFVGGTSAGAFLALQVVYMDQNEAPSSIASGFGFPALGLLDGEGNNYSHEMNITGYVDMWGAVGDSAWIQPDETIPGLLVHGTSDGTVPFGVGHPFGVATTPITYGSRCVANQLTALNIPHSTYFVEGQGHGFHGGSNGTWSTQNPPTPYYDTIFHLIDQHYSGLLRQDTLSITGPESICKKDTITYRVNTPNHYKLCWQVNNGVIIQSAGDSARIVFEFDGQAEISVKQFSEIAAYNGTTSLSITIAPLPTFNFLDNIDGEFVTFNPIPDGFVNYSWTFGDGNTSGTKIPTHQYNSPGIYTVSLTITDTIGCTNYLERVIDLSTLNLLSDEMNNLKVYPNPATQILTISNGQKLKRIILYSGLGKVVKSLDVNNNIQNIDISNLEDGVYTLQVIDENKKMKTRKISILK